jgi:hypothetical protein
VQRGFGERGGLLLGAAKGHGVLARHDFVGEEMGKHPRGGGGIYFLVNGKKYGLIA